MLKETWLTRLLDSRGLKRPDGRMLYGYRLTNDEYRSLHEELASEICGKVSLWHATYVVAHFAPLFVLYAAEWWRREYLGGAWRWTPIIESFGGDAVEFAANLRTEAVMRGFAYWGHRPSSEGKKFFGAVAAHGGLPLAFIGQRGGKLAAIMENTLRLAARYEWDESAIIKAVEEQAGSLPDSLHRLEIYGLVAKMVLAMLELRQEFNLAGVEDPFALLAERDPDWRQRFPLPLEDETAQKLLNGLVREAAQQNLAGSSSIFVVERQIRLVDGDRYELSSSLACPASVSNERLGALFGQSPQEGLPRYFSIDVQVGERQPLAECRQVLGTQTPTISLIGRKGIWWSHAARKEHSLFIRAIERDLRVSPLSVPGGQELPTSEPWVFARRNERIELIVAGSARVPEDEALVTVPAEWNIEPSAVESKISQVGYIDFGDLALPLFSVKGDATLTNRDVLYRVRTHQPTASAESFAWEGRRFAYPSSPQSVFLGLPKLYCYLHDGERRKVPTSDLAWFFANTQIRIDDINNVRGPVDVFVIRDGERITKFRFIVIDSAAAIDFASGVSASSGVISFDGWGIADISVLDQPELKCDIDEAAGAFHLLLRGGDVPPESVHVTMRWPRSLVELQIKLPFPSTGGRFFDGDGRVLRESDGLTVRHLVGSRLRIFDRNPSAPKRYSLALTLAHGGRTGASAELGSETAIGLSPDGSAELRLIDLQRQIEALMGFSNDLDAAVEVVLKVSEQRACAIRVSRYEVALEQSGDSVQFPSAATTRLDIDSLEGAVVQATSLVSLAEEPVVLEQEKSECVPTAHWSTTSLSPLKSPWLIHPGKGSTIFFRPTVYVNSVGGEVDDDASTNRCPLAQAIGVAGNGERMRAITSTLDEMSANFSHQSWKLIEQLWETFHHLPLNSLDTFRVLGGHLPAAVALLLRTELPDEPRAEFSRRLRDECGLVWELAPIDVWRSGLERLRDYWSSLSGSEGQNIFPIILRDRVNRIAAEIPALKLMLDFLCFEQTGSPAPELVDVMNTARTSKLAFARQLWRGDESLAQNLLFRGHVNDTNWPERNFFIEAYQEFVKVAPKRMHDRAIRELFAEQFWNKSDDYKFSAANTPVLCAIWAASGAATSWWHKPEQRLSVRRIIAFDPIWFEQAFRQSFASCLAIGLLESPPTSLTK